MGHCVALILVSCLVFVVAADATLVGGWKPINDPKHAHLKKIGDFAVSAYNKKAKTNLEFVEVVKGEMQVVSGINYRLVLEAKSKKGGKCKKYEAVVEEDASKTKTLSSFELVYDGGKCGWKPIEDLKDPRVTEIGQYAVTEYNRRAMKDLKLQKVEQGFSQVVAGTNYRLVLATKDGKGVGEKYEAIVWEKEWLHYRNLTSFAPVKSRN